MSLLLSLSPNLAGKQRDNHNKALKLYIFNLSSFKECLTFCLKHHLNPNPVVYPDFI